MRQPMLAAESNHNKSAEQGSISFLKKRNKKLLLVWLTRRLRQARTEASKSFLVLFFKKELLSWRCLFVLVLQASLRVIIVLLAVAGGTVPAAAQPNVSVTQHNALPTPDNGSPEAHNKKQPVYRLLGFSLRGTTRVDTNALIATLPQHEGDVITNAEIRENVDKISHVLQAKHVYGYITTMILQREGPGHHVFVMWDVQLEDALSYVPLHGPRHFGSQTFSGNVKLSTAALIAATNLHPGDKMMDGRVGDARTGIEQAYDKAMPGVAVKVSGKVKLTKDNMVLITWEIVEPKT